MERRVQFCLVVALFLPPGVLPSLAQQPSDDLFIERILPVFKQSCLGCHGEGQTQSGLDMRSREALLKGGSRGPAIVPGNAGDSLLYQALVGNGSLQMPPGGASKRLPAAFTDAIREWIDKGASWGLTQKHYEWGAFKEEDLWAFRPLRTEFREASIDRFILARLKERQIAPAGKADRRTLLRRVTLDLTGLPPAPEDATAFLNDRSPDAWTKVVDRLLTSPRYGERWGRHWLDVVRYADTSGYSNDFERPNAWRYRDYVIRAFNNDKPYDRFIREQIAGDELYPDNPEAVIATGFLRAGPWEHTAMSVEAVTRQMFLDDVTNAVGVTFLGLTLGCARCHDHKFDPIPTRDYYRMQAVFASTEFSRPALPFLAVENTRGLEAGRQRMQRMYRHTQDGLRSFDEKIKQALLKEHNATRLEDIPAQEVKEALQSRRGLKPEEFEHFKVYQKHSQLFKESLDRYEPKAFAVSSGPLDGATDGGNNVRYPKREQYKPQAVHILPGGNIQSPAEQVTPGVPGLVERYSGLQSPDVSLTVSGRRAALAEWIARPDNPLTARVMVNRIWQYHFGKGIAADTNNFGKMGRKPSHPELLDWLARKFIESGWSVKAMHRLILLSDTYQRASDHPSLPDVKVKDPNGDLFAYFPPRRMEAEELRDSILFVSGELSSDAGGPGTFPQINEDVARQPLHRMGSIAPAYLPSAKKSERNRRSIYMFQQRSLIDPMVEVFNGPNLDISCERRDAATIPTQAFTLWNSQFSQDMALALAMRAGEGAASVTQQITRAFQLAFGRNPEAKELQLAIAHYNKQVKHHRSTPPAPRPKAKPVIHMLTSELTGEKFEFLQQGDPQPYEHNTHLSEVSPEARALADLALVLLNSNEFIYVY